MLFRKINGNYCENYMTRKSTEWAEWAEWAERVEWAEWAQWVEWAECRIFKCFSKWGV